MKRKRRILLSDGRKSPHEPPNSQHSPTFDQIEPCLGQKRRRSAEGKESEQLHEPWRKRNRAELEQSSQQDFNLSEGEPDEQDPIQYWASTGNWPNSFDQMSGPGSDGLNKRRRSSTPSYSSRAKDRSVPLAHTAAYEEELQRYGISFKDWETKDLETYMGIFQRASKCNEERVRRDLTPHIVPSAELLYILDGGHTLENIREEMSVDWTKCSLLGGTQPRPDYAYGLSSATFTEEERYKMENYTNVNNPTKFTDSMYFPFLMCEAKCGKKNINDADRQNIHSASIAVNAIIQLCRAGGEDRVRSLHGQILFFSISHDNERVKIYGHFPLIRDGRTTFHRYYVDNYSLDGHHGRDRNTGSNFTRAVYGKFYPQHLKRIRQAIACLHDPRTSSMMSDISVGGDETPASDQSSQERDSSRPPLRRAMSRGSQGELTLMKQQMAKMEQMYKAQLEQQKEESQKHVEQQKEDSGKQMALLERLLDRAQGR
ncbi:hypothetical protein CLAFUW4_07048 [Fulvia fulva]|nr:hypothetical protein CLAFUR4_07057 [Fulvia fulva]WPV15698.1 hypothetical protein CLAFUW4_07048 [Fulvia fulva]WPV30835.1 hypothetical protein CLAFUW7_07048 [Fulvia fulva]